MSERRLRVKAGEAVHFSLDTKPSFATLLFDGIYFSLNEEVLQPLIEKPAAP